MTDLCVLFEVFTGLKISILFADAVPLSPSACLTHRVTSRSGPQYNFAIQY